MDELIRCQGWIEDALEYSGGTHVFADIVAGCVSGNMQLWPAERACMVTELVVFPQKKVVNVFLAGGDLDQIEDMQESIAQWARQQGCTAATISGRPGWTKVLKSTGWKPLHVTLSRELG